MNKQYRTNLSSPAPKCLRAPYNSLSRAVGSLLFCAATLFIAAQAHAVATVDYILTAPKDPVKPGSIAEFDVTLRNISGTQQNVVLHFTVPDFTTYNGSPPGTDRAIGTFFIAAGETQSTKLLFAIPGGNTSPPDGTVITLTLMDQDRAVSFSRTVVVRAAPRLNLQVSSDQGTVAPGQRLTYTLVSSNIGSSTLSGVQLSVPVPAGASFVSADGGGALNSGVVSWSLGSLPVGANRQLHVTFQVSSGTNTPLAPITATLTDSAGDLARASDTRPVYAAPGIDYIVTAPADPVKPGAVAEFDITLHNPSGTQQNVVLRFTVPDFTTYNGSLPGTDRAIGTFFIPAGETQSAKIFLLVSGGNTAPPPGATITLNLMDFGRGAAVSRSVVVRAISPLNLQVSSGQGTIAPGQNLTYTLVASNVGISALPAVQLTVPVPVGATFVSADGGGALNSGVVSWSLGSLPPGAIRRLHVTFQANPGSDNTLGPLEATLNDSLGNIARASDTRPVYAAPEVDYAISSPTDPVQPGAVAEFDITLHNPSGTQQNVVLHFTVPDFTTYNGSLPGTDRAIGTFFIPAGETQSAKILLLVSGGNAAPPPGATITLNLMDFDRGAAVSRTIAVAGLTPAKADFNNDGLPDWVLQNPSTRQTAIWFMDDAARPGAAYGPTLPLGWTVIDADQFGGPGISTDLLLFKPSTGQTAFWYFNGASLLDGAFGPTLPVGWTLVLSQDFNDDGKPDLFLYRPSTHQTAIWYLDGTAVSSGVYAPTLPVGWVVAGAADFNSDGKPDLFLWNASIRRTAIWYLNGATLVSGAYGPIVASGYQPALVDDFNRDGKPDLVLWNPSTHQSAIWHLNNTALVNGVYGPAIPIGWALSAPK